MKDSSIRSTLLTLLALMGLMGRISADAQTNTPAQSPQSTFLQSVTSYFSSFNTNLSTFQNEKGQVWAGADYISGVNVASSLGLRYDFSKSVSIQSVTRNAGIAGTILSEQLDMGVSFGLFDTQLTFGAGGGYDFEQGRPYGALFAEVKKGLTDHTFAGLRLETDLFGSKPLAPALSVLVGFTF